MSLKRHRRTLRRGVFGFVVSNPASRQASAGLLFLVLNDSQFSNDHCISTLSISAFVEFNHNRHD
jgi:hypothetical protein